MEEVSPAVAVPFRLGNLICDDSKLTAHMEIAGLKLIANTATLLSEHHPSIVSPLVSGSSGNQAFNCNNSESVPNEVTINDISLASSHSIEEENGEDDFGSWGGGQLMNNSCSLSVAGDTESICSEEFLGLKGFSEFNSPSSMDITENRHSLQLNATTNLLESTVESEHVKDVLAVGGGLEGEGGEGSDPKLFTRVLELTNERRMNRTVSDSVFEFDCVPLWGFTSICGRRLEMEDAVAAVPNFLKIPIQTLTDGLLLNGMNPELDYLTAHFFGVYDGHGGCQVHFLSSLPSLSLFQCTFCINFAYSVWLVRKHKSIQETKILKLDHSLFGTRDNKEPPMKLSLMQLWLRVRPESHSFKNQNNIKTCFPWFFSPSSLKNKDLLIKMIYIVSAQVGSRH